MFRDARLAHLFDYWRERRGNRPAPARRSIRPMEIPSILSIVHLIDVHEDPLAFRHRLIGSEVVEALGRDVTGKWVDEEIYGEMAGEVFDGLAAVAWEMRPYRRLSRLDWIARPWLAMESLEMPLSRRRRQGQHDPCGFEPFHRRCRLGGCAPSELAHERLGFARGFFELGNPLAIGVCIAIGNEAEIMLMRARGFLRVLDRAPIGLSAACDFAHIGDEPVRIRAIGAVQLFERVSDRQGGHGRRSCSRAASPSLCHRRESRPLDRC